MLISPMNIVYAPARKQMTVPSDQASVISAFNDILPLVGWTRLASFKATCSFPYPLGYPLVDGTTATPKRVVKCPATPFLRIGDATFNLYDPGKETPFAGSVCMFVAMTTLVSTGLDNLVAAITAATAFNASWATSGGGWVVNLEAKAAGPDWNLHQVTADGRWGGFASNDGYTAGGGYTFESAVGASIYRVTITSDINLYGDLLFSFLINSQIVQYRLASNGGPGQAPGASGRGNYIIIANGFGFVIFNYSDDGSYPYIALSLFCMAPQIPDDFVSVYAVLILGPRSFRFFTSWSNDAITTCLDGLPATFSTSGGYPRLLALRSPGSSLLTSANRPIITGAYVMFGYNSSSSAWVVGRLWDCATVSDILLDGAIIDGQPFTTISFQDGSNGKTRGSLMMLTPTPAQRSGTCDVAGNIVTKLTGDNFTGLNHLDPITISGHPYFVDAVTDASHLTLTVAISSLSSVAWTVP